MVLDQTTVERMWIICIFHWITKSWMGLDQTMVDNNETDTEGLISDRLRHVINDCWN